MFSATQKKELLALARASIASHFQQFRIAIPADEAFNSKRGVFVSLHIGKELRGCIGNIIGHKPIVTSIVDLAAAAAFRDPRFWPLTKPELEKINIEISVLSDLIPLAKDEEPVIGRDGLYIEHPYGAGLLLPQVASEWRWNPSTFLKEVCRKAGLSFKAYQDPEARVYRFYGRSLR